MKKRHFAFGGLLIVAVVTYVVWPGDVAADRALISEPAISTPAILTTEGSTTAVRVDARVRVDNRSYAPKPFEFEFVEPIPVAEAIAWAEASGFTNVGLDSRRRAGETIRDRSLSIDRILLYDDDDGFVSAASFGG